MAYVSLSGSSFNPTQAINQLQSTLNSATRAAESVSSAANSVSNAVSSTQAGAASSQQKNALEVLLGKPKAVVQPAFKGILNAMGLSRDPTGVGGSGKYVDAVFDFYVGHLSGTRDTATRRKMPEEIIKWMIAQRGPLPAISYNYPTLSQAMSTVESMYGTKQAWVQSALSQVMPTSGRGVLGDQPYALTGPGFYSIVEANNLSSKRIPGLSKEAALAVMYSFLRLKLPASSRQQTGTPAAASAAPIEPVVPQQTFADQQRQIEQPASSLTLPIAMGAGLLAAYFLLKKK